MYFNQVNKKLFSYFCVQKYINTFFMTLRQKNLYEELIDQMMIDEVAGLDKDIKTTLEGLSTSKKRMAILSILDKDRDLFLKIKNLVSNNEVSKTEHIKNVVEMLREYVKVGEVEKKTLGEVMTPISLVNDMLDTLPKEVWQNPNLKWLDPCAGVGIFPSVIIERLMVGLEEFEPDDYKRYKHILENQLYFGELQAKNMFLFLCAFDPNDEFTMNVYNGSYLTEEFNNHMKEVWEVDKFDVIVMNPPYQTNNPGQKKTHPIWDKFVKKSFEILIDGGYYVAVHPSGWRNVDGRFKDTQVLLRSKQMMYLEMHDFKDGLKTFGAQTDYDFYCIKNVNNLQVTYIKCQDGHSEVLSLKDMESIPNGNISLILSLVAKPGEETVEILHSYSAYETRKDWMSKELSDKFKFPCIQNVSIKNEISCLYYSSTNEKGHFGIPKVIFGRKHSGVMIDFDGKYGLAQDCTAIVDAQENLENIKKAIESEKFIFDVMGYRILGDKYNRKIIATFRKDFWKNFIK